MTTVWQSREQIERALEDTFNAILNSRMQDTPLVNPALSVKASGFAQVDGDWLGLLITQWFMNLLLLPTENSGWRGLRPGSQFEKRYPYGVFLFTVANESPLGVYAQCSLFSPMFQFHDQTAAIAAAQSALGALLAPPAPQTMSRRRLLRLSAGNR